MKLQEKLEFAIGTELDFYINESRDGAIENKEVRDYVVRVVIPRLTTLRLMVNGYDKVTQKQHIIDLTHLGEEEEISENKLGKTDIFIDGEKHSSQG